MSEADISGMKTITRHRIDEFEPLTKEEVEESYQEYVKSGRKGNHVKTLYDLGVLTYKEDL